MLASLEAEVEVSSGAFLSKDTSAVCDNASPSVSAGMQCIERLTHIWLGSAFAYMVVVKSNGKAVRPCVCAWQSYGLSSGFCSGLGSGFSLPQFSGAAETAATRPASVMSVSFIGAGIALIEVKYGR